MIHDKLMTIVNKKPKLKPLLLGDVIVAFVNQQKAIDRTTQLKRYLTKKRKMTEQYYEDQMPQFQDQQIVLPQFAKVQIPFSKLLQMQLQIKRQDSQKDIKDYEEALEKVQGKFKVSLVDYQDKLAQGQNHLQNLRQDMYYAHSAVVQNRKMVKILKQNVSGLASKIIISLRKSQNLQKTILIARAWNKSNISSVLLIKKEKVLQYNIDQIMQKLDKCLSDLNSSQNTKFQGFQKVIKVVQDRKTSVIIQIQQFLQQSIKNFTTSETYRIKFNKYTQISNYVKNNNLKISNFKSNHILNKAQLAQTIQQNSGSLYYLILSKFTTMNNLQLLNQNVYTIFFEQVMKEFIRYFQSFHKVTSFHINQKTEFAQNFINLRTHVFLKLSQKIGNALKYSQKFTSLSFPSKIKLIEKISNFLEQGESWMGKHKTNLPQMISQKFKSQKQNFTKQTNGNLKVAFSEQFSADGLAVKLSKKQRVDLNKIKQIYLNIQTDRSKIKKMLYSEITLNNHSESPQKNKSFDPSSQKFQKQQQNHKKLNQIVQKLIIQPPKLRISENIVKTTIQYSYRQQYLGNQMENIVEHIEFVVLLIYKICICDTTKKLMYEDAIADQKSKVNQLIYLVDKNPHDQNTINFMNDLRESFLRKKAYGDFYLFLSKIGNKFDNIVISGYISINKLYENFTNNAQMISSYHMKISMLIQDLLSLVRWLNQNKNILFGHTNDKILSKIQQLPEVLMQLGILSFDYYHTLLYKKYMETMQPVMKGLKWEVKKFNSETSLLYKEYKLKLLQTFRSSTLNVGIKDKEMSQYLINQNLEVFFKVLLEIYGRIDKINDNGRQLVRLDVLEITRILNQIGYKAQSWSNWMQKYLQICNDRSSKTIIQKVQNLGLIYPVMCWKSNMIWVVADFSSKQKKEYFSKIVQIYVNQLKELPNI